MKWYKTKFAYLKQCVNIHLPVFSARSGPLVPFPLASIYLEILLSNELLHSCEIKLLKLLNRDLYLALNNRMKPLNTQTSPSMCTKYNSGHAHSTVKEHFIGRSLEFSAFTFKFFSYSNSYVPITGYYLRH